MHSLKETEEDSAEAIDLSEKATSSEDWQQLQSLASTFSGVTSSCLTAAATHRTCYAYADLIPNKQVWHIVRSSFQQGVSGVTAQTLFPDRLHGCCACADERLRGTKVCDREGNLKPDTHFIFSTLPDASLVAEGQPALKLAPPDPLPLMSQLLLASTEACRWCKACALPILDIVGCGAYVSRAVLKACFRLVCSPDDLPMSLEILPDEIDGYIC